MYNIKSGQIVVSSSVNTKFLNVLDQNNNTVLDTENGELNIYKNVNIRDARIANCIYLRRGYCINYHRQLGGGPDVVVDAADFIRGYFYDRNAAPGGSTITFPTIQQTIDALRDNDDLQDLQIGLMLTPTIVSNNSNDDTAVLTIVPQDWTLQGSRLASIPPRCCAIIYPFIRNPSLLTGSLNVTISTLPAGGGGGGGDLWSTFAAVQNVNFDNFNLNNCGTITANTINASTVNAGNIPSIVQGSYVPTLRFGVFPGNDTGVVYAEQSGNWTRIGLTVILSVKIRLSDTGSLYTGSDTARIILPPGLPANLALRSFECPLTINEIGGLGASAPVNYPYAYCFGDGTQIQLSRFNQTAGGSPVDFSFGQFRNLSEVSFQLIYETV